MVSIKATLLMSLVATSSFSEARAINQHGKSVQPISLLPRSLLDAGHSLFARFPKKISFSTSVSSSTSTRVNINVGGKSRKETPTEEVTQFSGSPTLGNLAGHVNLQEVEGLVDSVGRSTCKGTGGIVSFKAETSETENRVSSSTSCNVKSSTVDGISVTVNPQPCRSEPLRSYRDNVLRTRVTVVQDCNLGLETLVYKDPELGKEVALYEKGDFTIRRFYEDDDFYKSIGYFVGCATNGEGVELRRVKREMNSALSKRGFFKGNTKDPIWNCALPNVDTVGGPKDSFMFAPANVGECLVIMASRECLDQGSVAFFWDE